MRGGPLLASAALMPKRKEVAMSSRKAMLHDDAGRTDRWVRHGDALWDAYWILYGVVGWAIAYLLFLSSSSTFRLGL